MPTNIKENGFETLIVEYLVSQNGYEEGSNEDYNKTYAIDETRLFRFLNETQKQKMDELRILESEIEKKKFLDRLSKKISDNGVITIIRSGFKYKNHTLDFYMVRPSEGNAEAKEAYENNIFSVTRQLRYSEEYGRMALDLCLFLNGLPIITIELKNQYTKQTYNDAIKQYKTDRSHGDLLFSFKRCIVHFAVDDNEVHMCTNICGDKSFFLPFNKGFNNGAGNPPNPDGIKTDYLWKEIFSKPVLSNILENYVQIIEEKDEDTGKKSYKQIFPRYHQLQVVVSLLADAKRDGAGHSYLIQHSAGSGKSNSIAWLAHQLVTLKNDSGDVFDTVIVVTDRINLDKQIRNTIKQFMQVSNTVGWAKDASTLKDLMDEGKKIIITIVHKFQFILDAISDDYKNKKFAIIIDEAHSSQNGSLAAKMNIVVSGNTYDDDDSFEDKLNALIEGKKMAKNASYFAFTATPKNKTLEMFGEKMFDANGKPILNEDGMQKSKPHYVYTMKQAIEEKFILDVLRYYTTYDSFYHLVKTVENDPLFDTKRAQRLLRYYVETQKIAVKEKSGIIVEHFHQEVCRKIKGHGRAMVVTASIKRAIEYYFAISKLLEERKSPYKAVVAFSGDAEYEGQTYNEAKLNGFPSGQIEKKFKEDPYRILIVANKFQTGYDEPLLQTMYVDKGLSDIKAVQTLSRLNRCYPDKNDVFVLDFVNDASVIKAAFDKYYKTTVLSGETDANKLNDLVDSMEPMEVYDESEVDYVAELYLSGANREDGLDQKIDICVERYKALDLDDQIEFKSSAKTFIRTYNFLSSILPYGSMEWEKLSIFLTFLVSKLPKPGNDDHIEEILEDVELESYRLVAQETMSIKLEDEDSEIDAVPVKTDVGIPVPEMDTLTNILATFHDIWGNCDWTDEDKIKTQVEALVQTVAQDEAYQNAMKHSDAQNARDESDRAAKDAIFRDVTSAMELYEAFMDDKRNSNNQSFSKWLLDLVFTVNYHPEEVTRV
ncbi:MAG: type I restriction endonuclease subunit R [Lachnospiraceae bacterium]|jgi:type I restriction enzyme R subunit|nr:type I restriction endonuclease subunit R [Lachnospiraceae bacterium]